LHNEVRVIRRNALLVIASLAVGSVAALSITSQMPRTYTSEADLFVSASNTANSGGVYDRARFAQDRVKSYVPLVTNPQVMAEVAGSLGLNTTPDDLANKITVSSPPDTVLLKIVVTSASAAAARDIANETARQFTTFVSALEGSDAGSKAVQLRITKPANLPGSASSPRPLLNLGLGLFLGAVVGLSIAALRERWRSGDVPLASESEWVQDEAWPPPIVAGVPARRRAARVR
jgi:succinoglycan biosynthesis transport protein ExoP